MKRKILTVVALALSIITIFSSITIKRAGAENEVYDVCAKAYVLADFYSNEEICSSNKNERLQIASMVKIMTLNIIFEEIESGRLSLNDKVAISQNASSMGGSQAFLDPNCSYLVEDLVKSIIVASANDSCVAMAEHIAGSVEAFVVRMNEKARELGMSDTNFVNCTGLPAPNAYSSAADVVKMSRVLMSYDKFFDYSSVWVYDLVHPSGRTTTLTNTNKLSRFYHGCDGGKTGYTSEAKSCLSATAKRGDTRLICVVIGAPSSKERNAEVSKLLDYGFANYENRVVVKSGETDEKLQLSKGKDDFVSVMVEKDLSIFCKKKDKHENVSVNYNYEKNCAPIKKGEKVGTVSVLMDGKIVATANLLAMSDVEAMNYVDFVKKMLKNW